METAQVSDLLGAPIEAGDLAVYVTTGRYASRGVVQVLQVKKRVQVIWLKKDRRSYGAEEPFYVEGAAIAVVEKFKGKMPERI